MTVRIKYRFLFYFIFINFFFVFYCGKNVVESPSCRVLYLWYFRTTNMFVSCAKRITRIAVVIFLASWGESGVRLLSFLSVSCIVHNVLLFTALIKTSLLGQVETIGQAENWSHGRSSVFQAMTSNSIHVILPRLSFVLKSYVNSWRVSVQVRGFCPRLGAIFFLSPTRAKPESVAERPWCMRGQWLLASAQGRREETLIKQN